MKPILDVGRNALVIANAAQSGLLIDARDYYRTLYRALEQAEQYAIITGWQFESGIRLLRGQDAESATRPVKLLEFLAVLCEERPSLHVYILAWDFSLVYAHDREPKQKEKFSAAHPRIHFVWDAHPSVGGSHHQKFVVVDGAIGFVGGIDLCDARWDDCEHLAENTDRVNVVGDPCKPYHDVQACFTGEIVTPLVQVFVERWQRATGDRLDLAAPSPEVLVRFDVAHLSGGNAEYIGAQHAALSRTQVDSRAEPELIGEILGLFSDAISSAQRSIYIETQYFTSRSIAQVLTERMQNATLPQLDIVVLLPHGADTPMEKMALEDTQETVLHGLLRTASEHGHAMTLMYPASQNGDGSETATFIHSKILIVDDRLLMVGSPNCTERSIGLDTELAVVWECSSAEDGLSGCIRNIRSKLLAEHSGLPARDFAQASGLCAKLEVLLERGDTRLRRRPLVEAGSMLGPLFAAVFDPGDSNLTGAVLGDAERQAGDA
jgi:phosphatidylserine/phosphatidylglycerophosphate/cardiolipin synthase-like enzyme